VRPRSGSAGTEALSGERAPAAHRRSPRIASIKISATSGRLNSIGGRSPARSISRTFVPESDTRVSSPWGQVLGDAIPSHALHQNECSNINGVMPSSPGSNESKIRCAS
jgi:hypothetical protein